MNYCYLRHTECEYANGAGFCMLTACAKSDAEVAKVVTVADGTGKIYDNINRPAHYASQSIEPIEYMRAAMTSEEFIGYCCGNIIKYCSRWRKKNGIEDLEKARQYLDWMIEAAEKEDKNDSSEA